MWDQLIETRLHLVTHGLHHRRRRAGRQGGLVNRFAAILPAQHLNQITRPGQASNMGGEDAIGA